MGDNSDLVQQLVQALRRIEADADGDLQHGGNLRQALSAIRDGVGNIAADTARRIGMAPYDTPNKSA